MPTGKLFVIDGVDGSGKSTTVDILRDKLWEKYSGDQVVVTRVPGGTGLGVELRRIVKSRKFNISDLAERLMFAADERQTADEVVNPALAAGKVVLSGRWSCTDYAYGLARGLAADEIKKIHDLNPMPMVDHLFILTLPFETILSRKRTQLSGPSAKHDRFETKPGSNCSNIMIDEDFLRKVHWFYDQPITDSHLACRCAKTITRIDVANMEPKEVAGHIFNQIDSSYGKD